MNTERQRQVRKLFDAAAAQSREEQTDFVRRHSAGDAELAEAVLRLLRASQSGEGFLAKPLIQRESPSLQQGTRIGAYKVLRQLGAGGMGVVYMAVRADGVFQRIAALKIIRAGYNSEQMIARFRRERQILAGLDHPNIARILDGGTTPDGLPYFVMDYVDGVPLNTFCSDHRAGLNQRLNLFRQACRAVQYLHTNRIVHRDLKPANILVTSAGAVKLLDFGIARLLDDNSDTRPKTIPLLTPEYASPEQVSGKPTTAATDIYSLGAILYELLTGSRPHETGGRSISEAIEAVTREEVRRPSQRVAAAKDLQAKESPVEMQSRLEGDLDSILLMALRKEPERRYASVSAFAEDVQNYQSGHPVAARKGTHLYVVSKFAVRNRMAISAILLLAAAFSWAGWLDWENHHLVAQIRQIQTEVRQHANLLSQNGSGAQLADLNQDLSKIHTNYTNAMPRLLSNPFTTHKQTSSIVDNDLAWLSDVAPSAVNDPSTAENLGRTYLSVAQTQWNPGHRSLKDPQGSLDTCEKALLALRQTPIQSGDMASLNDVERSLAGQAGLSQGSEP